MLVLGWCFGLVLGWCWVGCEFEWGVGVVVGAVPPAFVRCLVQLPSHPFPSAFAALPLCCNVLACVHPPRPFLFALLNRLLPCGFAPPRPRRGPTMHSSHACVAVCAPFYEAGRAFGLRGSEWLPAPNHPVWQPAPLFGTPERPLASGDPRVVAQDTSGLLHLLSSR